jgi:hypothetical protein
MVFDVFGITSVTVEAVRHSLHHQVPGVGKCEVIFRMTIDAFEFTVIGYIKEVSADDKF